MGIGPRDIPAIELLRRRPDVADLEQRYGRDQVVDALRSAADAARRALVDGRDLLAGFPSDTSLGDWLVRQATAQLASTLAPSLRPVINATGVIVHTNLGRAPLAEAAVRRIAEVATGYCTLEFDLESGTRGRRDVHAERLLRHLTGAEAAVVVNNNAAATMLVLAALAAGREVLISRAELVEIGGGFRVPDILRQSGAVLREVGTTNRTRVSDYAAAISPRTGLILRVHQSNFRLEGFTERPTPADLVALARRFDLPIVEDLGNGNVLGELLGAPGCGETVGIREPTVRGSLALGHDLVCVSGDKLLGGPQAGLILGRTDAVDRVRRHPLMRAFRVDKLTYAALEATLVEHLAGRAVETVPVARMIALSPDRIASRARALAAKLTSAPGLHAWTATGASTIGGGSAPGSALPTTLVVLESTRWPPAALAARLRAGEPPLVARVENDRVVLDLRTVPEALDDIVAACVAAAAGA